MLWGVALPNTYFGKLKRNGGPTAGGYPFNGAGPKANSSNWFAADGTTTTDFEIFDLFLHDC